MPDINAAYSWAINTCDAPNVMYSQEYRNQETINGLTYYDCSSFIWYALIAGGFDVKAAYLAATGSNYNGNAITTAYERAWLSALAFQQVPIAGQWLPGDILWRPGHTEMVYEGGVGQGRSMGAHSASRPAADQVSIASYTSSSSDWASLWRYGSGGAVAGISLYVIAAIAGNWVGESNLNPGRWEGGVVAGWESLNHGYGLGQWTNTNGDTHGRLWKLYDWLTNNGFETDSGPGQMAYFIFEDNWGVNYDSETQQYADLTAFLHSTSTDLLHLTRTFCHGWERIPGNIPARYEYAQRIYNYLLTNGNDPNVTEWIVGNRALTWNEIYNNAVMLYRYLGTGGGGGGTGAGRKMPVWMMCRPWWLL